MSRNKKNNSENQEPETKETRKDALRRLFLENNLVDEDVYKDKRGFVIITRSGIDKIVRKQGITVAYEPLLLELKKDNINVVIRAAASMQGKNNKPINMMSFGEASDDNLMGGAKKFPVAMAEKRAMSSVVLKISGFYEQGKIFGEGEFAE